MLIVNFVSAMGGFWLIQAHWQVGDATSFKNLLPGILSSKKLLECWDKLFTLKQEFGNCP